MELETGTLAVFFGLLAMIGLLAGVFFGLSSKGSSTGLLLMLTSLPSLVLPLLALAFRKNEQER